MSKKAKAIHPVSLLLVGSLHVVVVCHLKNNHLSCQVLFGCVMFRPIRYCHVMVTVRVRSGGAMSPFSSSLQSFFLVTIYLYGWMDYSDHTHNGVALHLSMGRSFAENYTGSLSIRLLFQRLIFWGDEPTGQDGRSSTTSREGTDRAWGTPT